MKWFTTRFLFSFSLFSLIFTSSRAEELPNFYLVKELNNGQTVRIETCYKKPLSNTGFHCPTKTDVDKEDLNHFLSDLNSIAGSNKTGHNLAGISGLGFVFGGAAQILTALQIFKDRYMLKKSPTKGTILLLGLSTIVVGSGILGLTVNMAESNTYQSATTLRDQIHSGIIAKKRNTSERQNLLIFERFEAFLQEFGRPVAN